jgi:hypothetical protein
MKPGHAPPPLLSAIAKDLRAIADQLDKGVAPEAFSVCHEEAPTGFRGRAEPPPVTWRVDFTTKNGTTVTYAKRGNGRP